MTGLAALLAGTLTVVKNFDDLYSQLESHWRDLEYQKRLQRPYPNLLSANDVDDWSSGRLQLALFQIDGYLGRLKSSPNWLKTCLTNSVAFPKNFSTQFNERLDIAETTLDRENKRTIQKKLDAIDLNKTEDIGFERINDPFEKLLRRSEIQLLSRYKESEISKLEKVQLYLMRNAIYGHHFRVFNTAKLLKYTNRRGWVAPKETDKTRVEYCNVFFLEDLHAVRELGALGRGILIRQSETEGSPKFLKPSLCACLAQPKIGVECRQPSQSNAEEFRSFVDLILEIVEGTDNSIAWTVLHDDHVAEAERETFAMHQDRLLASAAEINAALHGVFRPRNLTLAASQDIRRERHWGAKLTLSLATMRMLGADATLLRETTATLCTSIRDALENAGPFIPRMAELVASRPDPAQPTLAIVERLIFFNDTRNRLTAGYLQKHYGFSGDGIDYKPQIVVLHATGTQDADAAYQALKSPLRSGREGQQTGLTPDDLNSAMHYLIDRDGKIFRLMNDIQVARHVLGLDPHALGIAFVGADQQPPTPAQMTSASLLLNFLTKNHDRLAWLVGVSEASAFVGTCLWEAKDPGVRPSGPTIPQASVVQLRTQLAGTKLRGPPAPTKPPTDCAPTR